MSYSFWLDGILIGESDLDAPADEPRQLAGIFRPTDYGLRVFPRLTGLLAAGYELKKHLQMTGRTLETMTKAEVDEAFDTTPAGRKIIDIGRTLSGVEMRSSTGEPVSFTSISFSDLRELETLAAKLDVAGPPAVDESAPDAPRYIVSATLAECGRAAGLGRKARFKHPRGFLDN